MRKLVPLAGILLLANASCALAEEQAANEANSATTAEASSSTSSMKSLFAPKQGLRKGDNLLTIGGFYIIPKHTSSTVNTEINPTVIKGSKALFDPANTGSDFVPASSWDQPDTSVTANNTQTLALTLTHFLTDNWAINLVGGVPPNITLQGHGVVTVPGSVTGAPQPAYSSVCLDGSGNQQSATDPFACGKTGKQALARAKQWSPAVVAQYYFNDPSSRFRPYVGLGVSYNFFTNIKVGDNVAADQNANPNFASPGNFLEIGYAIGNNPACAGGPNSCNVTTNGTHVDATASRSFAPIFNAGFSAELGHNFFATAAVTYMPLKVKSKMYLRDDATNEALSTSTVTIRPDPLIILVGAGYRFGN